MNALLSQLYITRNFLGVMYREIKQAIVDMEKMFRRLGENREVQDKAGAPDLVVTGAAIRFEHDAVNRVGAGERREACALPHLQHRELDR